MVFETSSFVPSRWQFLMNILPAGTFLCLGCGNLLSSVQSEERHKVSSEKHKFQEDSGMTIEEPFQFAFLGSGYIPVMQNLANYMGKINL